MFRSDLESGVCVNDRVLYWLYDMYMDNFDNDGIQFSGIAGM